MPGLGGTASSRSSPSPPPYADSRQDPMPPIPPIPPLPFSGFMDAFGQRFGFPAGSSPGSGVDHAAGEDGQASHGFAFGPNGFNAWFGPRGFDGFWGGRGGGGGSGGGGGGGGPWQRPPGSRSWTYQGGGGRGGRGGWEPHGGGGGPWGRFGRDGGAGEAWGFGDERGRGHWGGHRGFPEHEENAEHRGDVEMRDEPTDSASTTSAGHHDDSDSDSDSSTTVDYDAVPHTPASTDFPDPPEEEPWDASRPRGGPGSRGPPSHHHHRGHHRHVRAHGRHGPRGEFGRRGRDSREGPPPPPPGPGRPPFDLMAMLSALGIDRHAHGPERRAHGLERQTQRLRSCVPGMRQGGRGGRGRRHGAHSGARGPSNHHHGTDNNDERGQDQAFAPPVDIFNHAANWTVHVALPGAKKEDIAVNWDAERSHLAISGIVHRPGDEEFLRGLVSGERRVGLFERHVRLPPDVEEAEAEDGVKEKEEKEEEGEGAAGEKGPKGSPTKTKDEVDADGITARMEDGVLIVLVPKIEKEWTQVRKVNIH